MKKFFDFSNLKGDMFGGITAGIVALPLALAFGEQSGLGAAAGLYGAAFIAFFAALFGGTSTQISGPTAPMTALSMVIITGILLAFEGKMELALPSILLVFFLAGAFQIILGAVRLGTLIRYIPYPVVSGFMSGIGVIILITQILPAVGYYSAEDQQLVHDMKPLAEERIMEKILDDEVRDSILVLEDFRATISRAEKVTPEEIELEATQLAKDASKGVIGSLSYLDRALKNINYIELLLTIITLIIIYGFKRITEVVPSTLVALTAVTGGAYFLGIDYVKIQEIPAGFPDFHLDIFNDFNFGVILPFVGSAFLLALLGTIDSLLTSVVADNMTKTQHNPDRELVGQGIGNGIAALFGGIPGAGATIRTVVNIDAGGRTKLSGMFSGVLLFIILIALGPIASTIPAAVLAGILISVGIGVMDYKGLKALPRMEHSEKLIILLVLVLTVFWNLVFAVGIGLILAALIFLKRMSDVSIDKTKIRSLMDIDQRKLWDDEVVIPDAVKQQVYFKHLHGPIFFGFVSGFRESFTRLPAETKVLVIRMEEVPFIDQSGISVFEDSLIELEERGIRVVLSGLQEQPREMLRKMHTVPKIITPNHIFKDFNDCKKWLWESMKGQNMIS